MPAAQCLKRSVMNFYIRCWVEVLCFEQLSVDDV